MKASLRKVWSDNGICSPKVCFALILISAIVLLLVILITVGDVFGRFAFDLPIKGAKEISQVMMPWAIYIPFAYALVSGSHVRVTIIADRVRFRPTLTIITYVIDAIFLVFSCMPLPDSFGTLLQ